MALPRYQNIGVVAGGSIDRLPAIDFPSRGEGTRGLDAISNALDVMAGAFFQEAKVAATEEGRIYGAQNAPSQEQIKLAVETGTPIQPIGDSRTYFGRAAQEVSGRIDAILDALHIKLGLSLNADSSNAARHFLSSPTKVCARIPDRLDRCASFYR